MSVRVSPDSSNGPLELLVDGGGGGATTDVNVVTTVGLTDAELRASPVPVEAAAQPGVDIGDVTVNNGAGASAVNIQDGGNTITVDGTVNAAQSGTWNINNVSGTVSLPTGAATETTLQTLKASLDVTALQVTASGDTTLLSSGTHKVKRVEASNSDATDPVVVGLKNANLNGGAVFGKKYLPAAGGLAIWVFPDGYLQITSSTFVVNLSAAVDVEFTVYYE